MTPRDIMWNAAATPPRRSPNEPNLKLPLFLEADARAREGKPDLALRESGRARTGQLT